jgi:hypothetical protein
MGDSLVGDPRLYFLSGRLWKQFSSTRTDMSERSAPSYFCLSRCWRQSLTGADDGRLSPLSSYHPNLFGSCHFITDIVVCFDGRTLKHMAGD